MRWPLRPWLIGIIAIVFVVTYMSNTSSASTISDFPPSGHLSFQETLRTLDCLKCHPRTLEVHDSLGSENNACWVCFDNIGIEIDEEVGHLPYLLLADDTPITVSDSSLLCGQCHQENYKEWQAGIHEVPGADKAECADCHDPHKPQIIFLDTEPHPQPEPSPSPPSVVPLALLGGSLLLVLVLGVVMGWKGRGT